MVTTRVEEIRQMIIDRHDGAISNITICLGTYETVNALDRPSENFGGARSDSRC